MEGKFVSYLRVSTDRQGKSGLGLEAQRQAITNYLNGGSWVVAAEFVEVESGRNDDRPQLREALEACERLGATLLIAKLDRLSRDVAFIAKMMRGSVEFVACDFPAANRLTIHILSAVAEHEREMISKRTKEALAAAKARGTKLGNPHGLSVKAAQRGRLLGIESRRVRSREFAAKRIDAIKRLREEGLSLNAIARRFNAEGTLTSRGKVGSWTATTVRTIIRSAKTAELA